jgi:hypothetical protein
MIFLITEDYIKNLLIKLLISRTIFNPLFIILDKALS